MCLPKIMLNTQWYIKISSNFLEIIFDLKVSLIGLAVSVRFARFANSSRVTMWTLYLLLTIVHMYSNYKAMRVLALRSLNISRFQILAKRFIETVVLSIVNSEAKYSTAENNDHLFSTKEVALREPILSLLFANSKETIRFKYNNRNVQIYLWHSPADLRPRFESKELVESIKTFSDEKYMIVRYK